MNPFRFFRKKAFLFAFLPFAAQAQKGGQSDQISGKQESPEAFAIFLQEAGILGPRFTFSPADVGFAIDTVQPKSICCDVLFMEVLRSHLTHEQLVSVAETASRRTPLILDSTSAQQATLHTPITAGNLIFVLVENGAPASRSASLIVLKKEGRNFSVIEKSPLCRARHSATDTFRK